MRLVSKPEEKKHRVTEHTEVKQKTVGWVRAKVNVSPIEKFNWPATHRR